MIGYGIGHIGQGASYNFMSVYFVLFLTNCVGVSSSLAGTISSLALLVEVVAGMIIGNVSDHWPSPMGRRRPFILFAALAMPPILLMLTRTIHAGTAATFAYYLFFAMLFRVVFSCYEIPNSAFGVEIAAGYDTRTKLRTMTRAVAIVGNAIGYIAPLLILDAFSGRAETGWQVTGALIAGVCFTTWLICVVMTRGKGRVFTRAEADPHRNVLKSILKNYLQLCRLKAMRLLIAYKAAFGCAFALYNIGTIYYLQYSIGIGNRYASYMYAFTIVVFLGMTPLISKWALKAGKANQQKYSLLLAGAAGLLIYCISPGTLVGGILYMGIFSAAQTGFWQMSNSIFYDVVEVDEYVNFQRREGEIMSLVSVLGTLISAVMVQIFGIVLELSGYNAALAVQSEQVVHVLNSTYILVPSLCMICACLALQAFPINKKTFVSLQQVLQLRREGKDYSAYMEDIRKITGEKE